MRINTNTAALNSYNQLKNTNNNLSKSLSRLSSGKRINGAADDAAGLAISEKMGSQTRGLAQAQRNAQDGISMIQTAEGALKESHSILQRMRELSVQSANDTNTEADRAEIQKEVDQLAQELTRIGETTEFNTQKLLDGSLDDTKFQIGANEGQNMDVAINDMRASELGVAGSSAVNFDQTATIANSGDSISFEDGDYSVMEVDDYVNSDGEDLSTTDAHYDTDRASVSHVLVDNEGNAAGVSEDGLTFDAYDGATANDADTHSVTFTDTPSNIEINGTEANAEIAIEPYDADDNPTGHKLEAGKYEMVSVENHATYTGHNIALADNSGNIVALGTTDGSTAAALSGDDVQQWVDVDDTSNVLLQHNANTDFEVGYELEVSGEGIDVSTQEAADAAISTLDDAIANVSAERSKLGAVQNRLDHTINNLNTAEENLTAAESRISDVDMAKEMMNMSKQQILSQAGTAMMAQANQLPQGVLQLLG